LLSGERVALNYLQRLSGIATATRRAVDAVAGTGAVITDTRKTTPGLRPLEKYAVRIGGGENHRASLAEAVLWKDNHWELLGRRAGGLTEALRGAPEGVQVCVEVESERQLDEAAAAGVDWLLVDNQTPDTIASWSRRLGPGVTIEASGGITPETARPFAEAGAQRISIGALTYAPDLASISFEVGLRS
jgi:nicotinate-nucleotide pyrophosphorylase (carboxylating)